MHYQHSCHTKSKTQQLLGGKLTLSQLKPGHGVRQLPNYSCLTILMLPDKFVCKS